nr:MAG TPA: hypothetical protein [Bacteriophage sp.]
MLLSATVISNLIYSEDIVSPLRVVLACAIK